MERVAGKYLGEKELDAIAAAVAEQKNGPVRRGKRNPGAGRTWGDSLKLGDLEFHVLVGWICSA